MNIIKSVIKHAIKHIHCLLLSIAALPSLGNAAPTVGTGAAKFDIVYAKFSATDDPREKFPLAVLELAMKKMHAAYTIRPSTDAMERGRALLELEKGERINLAVTSMSAEAERKLRPIRIPLSRGLIGHRIFLINKDKQAAFSAVRTLEDLRKYQGGVGLGWVDGTIMQLAGLQITRAKYDELFRMTSENIVDYFPRGANEIFAEWDMHRSLQPNLAIENRLMLVYRSDWFFYTNKKDEALASIIEKGLLAAYEDGSYMKLFNEHPYIQQVIKAAKLNQRIRIDIPNPALSDEDRAIPEKFWMN